MLGFQKLDVYRCSIDFLVKRGNADLADQLRRAAQSISYNIAEGAGRATRLDKAKHYTIARGSAMECAAHLDVMLVEEQIEVEDYDAGVVLLERTVSMLTKLIDP
jgi:four helix bundle protein